MGAEGFAGFCVGVLLTLFFVTLWVILEKFRGLNDRCPLKELEDEQWAREITMGRDSDIAVCGQTMRALKQERHAQLFTRNIEIIRASGKPFTPRNSWQTLLFRWEDHPPADFFPSTGRWRSGNRTYSGGAANFLHWYSRQEFPKAKGEFCKACRGR